MSLNLLADAAIGTDMISWVTRLGFPIALVLIIIYAAFRGAKWLGERILLPLTNKHMEFVDHQAVQSDQIVRCIETQTDALQSIKTLTGEIHGAQQSIDQHQLTIVNKLDEVVDKVSKP